MLSSLCSLCDSFEDRIHDDVIKKKHFGLVCLFAIIYKHTSMKCSTTRAGVLVLGTRTRSTRVLNFCYSYCTRTREFQSDSTHTCTRTRTTSTRTSTENLWYICDVRVKTINTCEINSMTYHKGKVPNWFILLWFEYMIHGMWLQIP